VTGFAVLVLLSLQAGAPEPPAPREDASPVALRLAEPAPAPTGRLALAHTAAIATTLATGALAGLAGWFIPGECFAAQGRPDPLCSGVGLLLGAAVQVGLAWLLVPEVYRLADDASGRGSISEARQAGWRWSRWAALAGLAFVGTYLVGAAVEKSAYGRGQAAMLVGALGAVGSWVTFDVTELLGASAGYQSSRRREER
jgi:hypothetical protein